MKIEDTPKGALQVQPETSDPSFLFPFFFLVCDCSSTLFAVRWTLLDFGFSRQKANARAAAPLDKWHPALSVLPNNQYLALL